MSNYLIDIVQKQKRGIATGAVSACTANSFAIKAAIKRAGKYGVPVLIEATANQVDQNGGYTGMTPADFVGFVKNIAVEMGYPFDQIILGGDHLGPLTKTKLPEAEAMEYAERLVHDYVMAGFTKIHLDTSMRLAGDPKDEPLSNRVIAGRGARLCKVAEEAYQALLAIYPGSPAPVYVIGSEVPIPGGAQAPEEGITVTSPENCRDTFETFKSVFSEFGLETVFPRFIAIVVQPGVEFGDAEVFQYDTEAAKALIQYGKKSLPVVYEGHSTDYQTKDSLKAMVQDGIAILKVGPALTFALREALFALEMIEKELYFGKCFKASNFRDVLEMAMLDHPDYWKNHYHGDAFQLHFARKFSYSDRARYYLPVAAVENAIQQLIRNIDHIEVPVSLISQYMPAEYQALCRGSNHVSAEDLILEHIGFYLDDYYHAIL